MVQLVHPGRLMNAARGAPVWAQALRRDGQLPVYALNYRLQEYYGAVPADMWAGTLPISGVGLTINTGTTIDGTAANIALRQGDYTIIRTLAGRSAPGPTTNGCIESYSTVDATMFILGFGWVRSLHINSAGSCDNNNRYVKGKRRCFGFSQGATDGRSITQNGCPVLATNKRTAAFNHPAPSAIKYGRDGSNAQPLNDDVEMEVFYNFKVADASLQAGTVLPYDPLIAAQPYIRGLDQHYLTVGANRLQYEADQPWSCLMVTRVRGIPDATGTWLGGMGFTNVSATSVFPGFELWTKSNSNKASWNIRIISDVNTAMLEVMAAEDAADNLVHVVGASYDGGRDAGGCKIYSDGPLLTLSTIVNTLGAGSIIGGTQTFLIGNQTNRLGYNLKGDFSFFHMDNVARDAAWFAAHATVNTLPTPEIGTTVLHYRMDEGSGNVIDYSESGFDAVPSTADMWQA